MSILTPGIPLAHQLHRSWRWLSTQLQIIGRGLAVLHNGPETLQEGLRQNDFAKEAKVARRASEYLEILRPETHGKILEILDTAQKYYSHLPQEQPTFTHADFKSDHLLSTSQGLTLIDLDTCTLTTQPWILESSWQISNGGLHQKVYRELNRPKRSC